MTVSNVTSTPAISTPTPTTTTRAADGDYLVKNSHSTQTKDADGDYSPIKTSNSPASVTTSAVQTALETLKKGG